MVASMNIHPCQGYCPYPLGHWLYRLLAMHMLSPSNAYSSTLADSGQPCLLSTYVSHWVLQAHFLHVMEVYRSLLSMGSCQVCPAKAHCLLQHPCLRWPYQTISATDKRHKLLQQPQSQMPGLYGPSGQRRWQLCSTVPSI